MAAIVLFKSIKNKGVVRKGKLEFVEKNKSDKKVMILQLTEELENELDGYINEIQDLIVDDKPPEILNSSKCKNVHIMNIVIYDAIGKACYGKYKIYNVNGRINKKR